MNNSWRQTNPNDSAIRTLVLRWIVLWITRTERSFTLNSLNSVKVKGSLMQALILFISGFPTVYLPAIRTANIRHRRRLLHRTLYSCIRLTRLTLPLASTLTITERTTHSSISSTLEARAANLLETCITSHDDVSSKARLNSQTSLVSPSVNLA